MREINNLVDGWLAKNKKISHFQQNDFLRKLTLFWPKIVGEKYSIYSTPSRIIKESKKLILIISVYNGAVTLQLQSKMREIEASIKREIGFSPISTMRIQQRVF